MIEKILERLENELKLADEEKERCSRENPLQFDRANGYASGIDTAIEIVQKVAKEYDWISVTKKLPEEHKRALVELSNGWQVVATHDGEEWVLVWHYYMPIETDYVKVVQWRYLDAPYQKGE